MFSTAQLDYVKMMQEADWFISLATSLSSLASLSLSSSMVISSRGWGAKGVGYGGGRGPGNAGVRERLISCSKNADRQKKGVRNRRKDWIMLRYTWQKISKYLLKVFSSSSHRLTSPTNFLWKAFTFGFNYKKRADDPIIQRKIGFAHDSNKAKKMVAQEKHSH